MIAFVISDLCCSFTDDVESDDLALRLSISQTGSMCTQGHTCLGLKSQSQSSRENQTDKSSGDQDQGKEIEIEDEIKRDEEAVQRGIETEKASSDKEEPSSIQNKAMLQCVSMPEIQTISNNKTTMSQPSSTVMEQADKQTNKHFKRSSSDPFALESKKNSVKSQREKILKQIKENPLIQWKDDSDIGM